MSLDVARLTQRDRQTVLAVGVTMRAKMLDVPSYRSGFDQSF